MKMRKNVFVIGFISLVLITTMVLTNCEEEPEPEKEYGSLTVNNLPDVTPEVWGGGELVYWVGGVYFNEEITNYAQLHNWTLGNTNVVASYEKFDKNTSTFNLEDSHTYEGFNKTGNYLITLAEPSVYRGYYAYSMSNVHFTKGKATIDFKDMQKFY
jgi:hypothetical protein